MSENMTRYHEKKVWARKDIREYLQRRAKLLGHTPTVSDLNLDREGPSKSEILKVYKSYESAIKAARLKPLPKPWSKWTKRELINLIKEWYENHPNAVLTHSLLQQNPELPSPEVVKRNFGGIKEYLEAAGIPYVKPERHQWGRLR